MSDDPKIEDTGLRVVDTSRPEQFGLLASPYSRRDPFDRFDKSERWYIELCAKNPRPSNPIPPDITRDGKTYRWLTDIGPDTNIAEIDGGVKVTYNDKALFRNEEDRHPYFPDSILGLGRGNGNDVAVYSHVKASPGGS